MTNIKVEAFSLYGVGNSAAVRAALLAGAFAEIPTFGDPEIVYSLPWDATDESWWMAGFSAGASTNALQLRGVLPAAEDEVVFSFHMAMAELPPTNNRLGPFDFRNGANAVIGTLYVQSTGALNFNWDAGTATTSGPVIVAERDHHIELKIKTSATTSFLVYVDDVLVLTATGWVPTFAGPVAQFGLNKCFTDGIGDPYPKLYVSHLVIRDLSGSYNNTFPIGDRRVATLLVDSDDEDHDGWEPQPLQRFGSGILLPGAWSNASIVGTNLGAGDFTIEGQFRFRTLPTGANVATLFSKWRTDTNQRSYRLYKGGPSANNGHLIFQTSTDGTAGTTAIKIEWPWEPVIGQWHHLAVCRDGGDLKLFIDGVQQGVDIADGDTYFAGTSRTGLGVEQSDSVTAINTFAGWMDETRLTVGLSRYTTNFAPPTTLFPRNGADADWANVGLLVGCDTGIIADDGPLALTLAAVNSGAALTPGDGDFAYETINKNTPSDVTFIEAALIPAQGTFTLTVNATNTETVTVGTTDGATPAVYTFKTVLASAYDVLIGIDIETTIENFVAALNGAAGEGTLYGTGTVANYDVDGEILPSDQLLVVALIPGTVGNAIPSTDTCANGSWGDTTLDGGEDIPPYSQFGMENLPRGATIVDSITMVSRQFKTDAGVAQTQISFVGPDGAADSTAAHGLGTAPSFYYDTFEEDPDTAGALTPATVNNGKVKIDRTA